MSVGSTTTSTFTDSTAPALNTRARAVTSLSTATLGLSPGNVAMRSVLSSPSPVVSEHGPVFQGHDMSFHGTDSMTLMIQFMERERQREREEREREREREREERKKDREVLQDMVTSFNKKENNQGTNGDAFRVESLRIPVFDETEDIDTYLLQFERIAKLQQWDKRTWAVRLATLLTGKAREVYVHLSDDDAQNYDILKSTLLARYKLSAETYRKRLRSVKKENSETFPQLVTRMKILLKRWIALADKSETFDDLFDMLLCEQLLNLATPELALFIRERKPKNVDEAATFAEHFAEARRASLKEERSQKPAQTPESDQQKPRPDSPIAKRNVCFNCGGPHLRRDCPKTKSGSGVYTVVANASNVVTDDRGYNPLHSVTIEGVAALALRDTGADTLIVGSSYVPGTAPHVCQQKITLADGRSKMCPIVLLTVDTPFFSGTAHAIVMENTVRPLLIGNQVTFQDGTVLPVGVFPSRIVNATFQTRAQAEREAKPITSLPVKETEIGDYDPAHTFGPQRTEASIKKYRRRATVNNPDTNGRVEKKLHSHIPTIRRPLSCAAVVSAAVVVGKGEDKDSCRDRRSDEGTTQCRPSPVIGVKLPHLMSDEDVSDVHASGRLTADQREEMATPCEKQIADVPSRRKVESVEIVDPKPVYVGETAAPVVTLPRRLCLRRRLSVRLSIWLSVWLCYLIRASLLFFALELVPGPFLCRARAQVRNHRLPPATSCMALGNIMLPLNLDQLPRSGGICECYPYLYDRRTVVETDLRLPRYLNWIRTTKSRIDGLGHRNAEPASSTETCQMKKECSPSV